MITSYFAFRKNELGQLYLHPDFSIYGYDTKEEILEIIENSHLHCEIFIIESYRKDIFEK